MKFKSDIEVQAGLRDGSDDIGTAGQILSSTGSLTNWIDQDTIISAASKLVVIACKNTSGATITKGTPVYQTGTVGATDVIEIAPADALISSGKQPAIGLLQTDLNNNDFGNVVITGELLNFTTDPIDGLTPTTGDKVFLKSGGGLTLTKPTGAGNGIQNLGLIGKVSGGNAGSITVSSIMRTNDVPNLTTGKIWVGDGNTIESSVVFLDEPNGRMGIGTTSPENKLHVQQSALYTGIQTTAGIRVKSDGGSAIGNYHGTIALSRGTGSVAISAVQEAADSDVMGMAFFTHPSATGGDAAVEQMRIDQNGNVGIGTTSPGQKLEVAGNVAVTGTNVTVANASNPYIYINDTNAGAGIFQQEGNTTRIGSDSNTQVVLVQNNATAVTIDTSKNVGINTTSPDFKLDVDGTFGVSDLPFNTDSVSVLVADEITGADLVTNGDFSNGTTGWSFGSGWAVSNGGATVSTAGVTNDIRQTLSYVASISAATKFRYRFEITDITAGSLRLFVNKPTFTQIANVSAVGVYEYDVEVSTGSNGIFYLYSTTSGGSTFQGTVTNVSVKEITPVSNQIQKRELGTGAFGPTPVGAYLPLAGGTMTGNIDFNDSVRARFGDGNDLQIVHDGSNSYIHNVDVGDLYIRQTANDKDIIFQSDDGSGGTATYFYLDGSLGLNRFLKDTLHNDNVVAKFGTGSDLRIQHSSGNNSSYIQNYTGDLVIENLADDKDIIFKSDDGSGGTTPYLTLDSSITKMIASKDIHFDGTVKATFGSNATPASIYYNGNEDVDTGTETVASVVIATHTAAFFDFVIKKTTNVRSGTVYACHDGTSVEFTETSTQDLGDTSDVTLSVDISGGNMRLLATVTSDDWSVKSLIRAI